MSFLNLELALFSVMANATQIFHTRESENDQLHRLRVQIHFVDRMFPSQVCYQNMYLIIRIFQLVA